MGINTKIFVFKAKELIYTGIFIVLGVLFLLLLLFMLLPEENTSPDSPSTPAMEYLTGVYTSSIHLGNDSVEVQVTITDDQITSVSLSNLSEETAALYPLLTSAVEEMNTRLSSVDSIDDLTFDSSSQYTNTLLKQAVQNALSKALKN